LENAINHSYVNSQSTDLTNILNNQPNQNSNYSTQMNNYSNNKLNKNLNQYSDNLQQNKPMTELIPVTPEIAETPGINRIRMQTPVRLEMEMPYIEMPTEVSNYSNNYVKKQLITPIYSTENSQNKKIKDIIKKSAELTYLALEGKEPLTALKSLNYAIAYVSILREIYGDEQIQNIVNLNLNQYFAELLKIQNNQMSNLKNTCGTLNYDKQYLLKIINQL
jgi:hypothetical protein